MTISALTGCRDRNYFNLFIPASGYFSVKMYLFDCNKVKIVCFTIESTYTSTQSASLLAIFNETGSVKSNHGLSRQPKIYKDCKCALTTWILVR